MTDKVYKYRKRHKKCKYCTHLRDTKINCGCVLWCEAKSKLIKTYLPDMTNFPRGCCTCYEQRTEM